MPSSERDFRLGLQQLEEVLMSGRPRLDASGGSAAILVYPPREELAFRDALRSLTARLENHAKVVLVISLAELVFDALRRDVLTMNATLEDFFELERNDGFKRLSMVELLEHRQKIALALVERVSKLDPANSVVFLVRTGIFYPYYRASTLLEQLLHKTSVPMVLCYPGARDGETGLRFLNALAAERGYRQLIYPR